MVFLGELPISHGDRKVHGRVGYASQQAWIFSGTVKENIVFGQEFDKDRYLEVIEACALQKVGNCMNFIVLSFHVVSLLTISSPSESLSHKLNRSFPSQSKCFSNGSSCLFHTVACKASIFLAHLFLNL